MKISCVLLLCLAAMPLTAADLTPQVLALANKPVLSGASWSAVADYTQGKHLFSIQPDLRLAPASTLKLLTSAAALEAFGPEHRFETRIYADAMPDVTGALNGNIYIRGGGDPTLGSSRVVGSLAWTELLENWSKQIRTSGIQKINGHIYADVSLFSGLSLPNKTNWQNMGNYFAAPASALNFNDNSFKITFASESKHGNKMEVKSIHPQIDGLKIRSFVTADAKDPKDNAYVYAAPGQYEMEVHGTLPASYFKDYTISAALPDAPQILLDLFLEQLEKDGVNVSGGAIQLQDAPDYVPMNLLFTHKSPALKDIIYIVNKRSFNLYAETLLRMLAVQANQPGTIQNGLEELYSFLKRNGINTQDVLLYDGSGLSRDNQITAQVILDVLKLMSTRPYFDVYYHSLATPNDRGDLLLLRRFLAPLKRTQDVHVKGGTIDGVKAQAGYAKDKNGQLIAFVFIANNLVAKDESINRFYEELLKLLLSQPAYSQSL